MGAGSGLDQGRSSALSVALSWAVVVVPAAWGVYNTVLRAANLFMK